MNKAIYAKKCEIEILEALDEKLNELERDHKTEWAPLGTQHQKKDWRTEELQWEDEAKTIPVMVDDYGSVEKASLTEEDELYIAQIHEVRYALLNML